MDWLKFLGVSVLAVMAPAKAVLIAVFVLVLLDMATGVLAAKRRGEPITSNKLRRTVSKMFVFEASLIAAYLLERYLLSDLIPVLKLMGGVVGLVECKSIWENAGSIAGVDLYRALIDKLGSPKDLGANTGQAVDTAAAKEDR